MISKQEQIEKLNKLIELMKIQLKAKEKVLNSLLDMLDKQNN